MTETDYSEILRYLGYRKGELPEGGLKKRIEQCAETLHESAEPRSVYREFSLTHKGTDMVIIEGLDVKSRALAKNLSECISVYLMAATLGVGVDRLLAKASAMRISDAVIYQAVASTYIETYCDKVNDEIRGEVEKRKLYCRPRFSPGYGDFSVEHQRDFVRLLDTPRKIGLTLTDSCVLVPVKSVTAVIGVSTEPQPCHRRGCEECSKIDCAFRR